MNQVRVLNSIGVNHSNMLNVSDHQVKKATQAAFHKVYNVADNGVIQLKDGGSSFLDEIDEDNFGITGFTSGKAFDNAPYCNNEKLLDELMN